MFSIIVSTYNSWDKLKLFLKCFELQTEKCFEIIVADDGSSDQTKKQIEDYKKKSSFNILYVWHEDKGFRLAAIRNKAVTKSNYDHLIFMDADCLVENDFILRFKEIYEKHGDECLIAGRRRRIKISDQLDIDEKLLEENFQSIINRSATAEPASFSEGYLGEIECLWMLGCLFSCPKKGVMEINGFDEDFVGWGGEENDFALRIERTKKYKFIGCGNLYVYHLDHKEVEDRNGTALFAKKQIDNSIIRNQGRKIF